MGRYISEATPAVGSVPTGIISATKVVPAGYMGEFGNGLWRVFYTNGTFTVPSNVSKLRVRVVGAGGGGKNTGTGGAGGGYAHGVFTVTPSTSYAVTIGAGSAGNQPK